MQTTGQMVVLLKILTPLFYLVSALFAGGFLRSNRHLYFRWALALMIGGFLLHTLLAAVTFANRPAYLPQTLFETFLLLTWLGLCATLFVRLFRRADTFVSALAAMFVILFFFGYTLEQRTIQLDPKVQTIALSLHVAFMILGTCLLLIGCATSSAYLLERLLLKQKLALQLLGRIPSLQALERINSQLLLLGFLSLTAGLGLGLAGAFRYWHGRVFTDPKVAFSIVVWLFYAILLAVTRGLGVSGKRAAILSICGFVALLLVFIGAQLLFVTQHHY